MIRYFISMSDAKKIIFKDFSLHDDDLFIKKNNRNETVSINPIISVGCYSKNDVDAFAHDCLSKGKELVLEINPEILSDVDFTEVEILTYQELENGFYYKIDEAFEPNIVQLLDFDVLNEVSLPKNSYNIVGLLPSNVDSESLFLSNKTSVIRVGDAFSNRRNTLTELRLGCDLYLKPYDPELFQKYPEYLVELEEYERDVFKMTTKKHYFLNVLSEEDISFLPPETLKIYKQLIKKSHPIKIPKTEEIKYMIRRSDLGIDTSSYENIIEVYNQEGMDLVPINLSQLKGEFSK